MATLTRVERAKLKDLFLSEEEEIVWLHRKIRCFSIRIQELEAENKRQKKAMLMFATSQYEAFVKPSHVQFLVGQARKEI